MTLRNRKWEQVNISPHFSKTMLGKGCLDNANLTIYRSPALADGFFTTCATWEACTHTHTQKKDLVRMHRKDNLLQAKERGLRRSQTLLTP